MKRFLLCILLLLIPGYILADTSIGGFSFSPTPGDLSVTYLADIFGVVTGVLHGTGSQILGTMFGIFNAAVLSVGSVIVMYTLFVGTLYTAHEGKALGEKWGSLWVPIRMVIGIGAMIPQATGYSFIQIFVMWLVVQGVGAADSIWSGALGYIERGGILVQQTQGLASMTGGSADGNAPLAIVSGNILKAETCMYVVHNALMNQAAAHPNGAQVPDFTSTLQVYGSTSYLSPPCYFGDTRPGCVGKTDTAGLVNFPGDLANNATYAGATFTALCGTVNWNFSLIPSPTIIDPSTNAPATVPDSTASGSAGGAVDSRSTAVMQLVLDMQPLAYQIAQIILPVGSNQSNNTPLAVTDFPVGTAVNSSLDYLSIMGPYFALTSSNNVQSATNTLEIAKSQGWIMAGSYYFLLSSLNNAYSQLQGETSANIPTFTGFPTVYNNSFPPSAIQPLTTYLPPGSITTTSCNNPNLGPLDKFVCNEFAAAQASYTAPTQPSGVPTASTPTVPDVGALMDNIPHTPFGGLGPILSGVAGFMNYLPDRFNDLMGKINQLLNAQQSQNVDPIVTVSAMGIDLLDAAEYLWISGAIGAAVVGLIMGAIPSASMGTAATTFVVWIVGFLTVILMAMFETGMVMAYYIPLIPFIIFLFTTLGWFVGVIEAVIAGPLVALGLTVPEGHHQFGAVSHAIMLLMNIFLRPSFIIFGFIAGAIMSHVGLWIMNAGLGVALNAGQTPLNTDMSHILRFLALLIVYMTIVMQVVNRSFQLIYEIPNQVLQWLSPQGQRQFGEAEGVGMIAKDVSGKFGGVGQMTGEVGKQMMSVGPAIAKRLAGKGEGKDAGAGGGEAG